MSKHRRPPTNNCAPSLECIDLHGLGKFTQNHAGFRVNRYRLEEAWPYIYASPRLLLRVDQRGPDYVQFDPPGGSVLFRRERYQAHPSLLVWIKTGQGRAFTNFWLPAVGYPSTSEPEEFFCDYAPEAVLYHVEQDDIACDTQLHVPPDDAVAVMTCTIKNISRFDREVEILPVIRPHFASASLAPWDVPSLYQRIGYSNEKHQLFALELRSPAGLPDMREYAFVVTDLESPDAVEVDYAAFLGRGAFENPEWVMRINPKRESHYGEYDVDNSINGCQGIIALEKQVTLGAGDSFSFTIVMGRAESESPGKPPSYERIEELSAHLNPRVREYGKSLTAKMFSDCTEKRRIQSPDARFNRYVNEWLPLQLKWVSLLDRGWPTGMRGVRDNAQDITALIPIDPDHARNTILTLFSVQRSDGWFPRQYSVKGRHGLHDLRNYVDGGVWVWELLYDYICFTKDFDIINERIPWLDSDDEADVLTHAAKIADFYARNRGEHGLCLIREGDWNDSVNRAGLEGRGESVMVSCQVVMLLRQLEALMNHLEVGAFEKLSSRANALIDCRFREEAQPWHSLADRLKNDILTHALNSEGYLNGVFNDDGKWIFSSNDPDGNRRINIPVNAFGIISGVLEGENARRVIDVLKAMKQTDGWPLFWPPIGDPPIPKLGRIGEGDLAPGLGENGTPYNHGAHGFFGRAAAAVGDGDLLLEILRYMLPYDQSAHPVARAKTAPYAVVNHWKTAPGLEGHGGDCFLSGSISTALRNVYSGLFGIKPALEGLALEPALPSAWQEASVEFDYLNTRVHLTYRRAKGPAKLIADGAEVTFRHTDPVLGRECACIADRLFAGKTRVECVYCLP